MKSFAISIFLVMTISLQAATSLPSHYDPSRDAAADLETAKQLATEQDKHILIKVGGDWCGWCKAMEAYFESN